MNYEDYKAVTDNLNNQKPPKNFCVWVTETFVREFQKLMEDAEKENPRTQ